MSLCVIVPTRGRPEKTAHLVESWVETEAEADLLIALDDDDPELSRYHERLDHLRFPWLRVTVDVRRRMVGTLNHEAMRLAQDYACLGFLGDDHRPRTHQWDLWVTETLDALGTGICYGNDLIHGPRLPTAAFMTSNIVRQLGYMVPPSLIHLWVDNTWKLWGEGLGRLAYGPHVVIEHLHPIAGKSDWDDRYLEVNDGALYESDKAAFDAYVAHTWAYDLGRLQELP